MSGEKRGLEEIEMELVKSDFALKVIEGITVARSEIRIFTYVLSFHFFKKSRRSSDIYKCLLAAKERGVNIRVIVDSPKKNRSNFNTNNFSVSKLVNAGIPVRMPSGGRTGHAKVAIFDKLFCLVGSHNMTDSSFDNPFELSVCEGDPVFVSKVIEWFDVVWSMKTVDWGW